jgi:8-oxo-dGTP pyrophosphatase MutT (NUDIX family)
MCAATTGIGADTTLGAMGMSEYVRELRAKIGTDFLLVPSAAVAIRDDIGRVLLVQHVEGRWQLPGGAIEPHEDPRTAAARECLEEAGVVVAVGDVLGVFGGDEYEITYGNGDRLGFVPILFGGEIVDGDPHPDGDETQAVAWFSLEEAEQIDVHPATRELLRALSRPGRA